MNINDTRGTELAIHFSSSLTKREELEGTLSVNR